MALAPPEGFAIRRNGTCLAEESDCGTTLAPFRACCPQGASCFGWHNKDCCVGSNCTQTLLEYPSCANSSWKMYKYGGYFCCAPQADGIGYDNSNSDGCAEPGSSLKGVKVLGVLSQSRPSSTSTFASTSTSSTAPTDSPSTTATSTTSNRSLGGGAIAGIVTGVVVAIGLLVLACYLLFFSKRRKAKTGQNPRAHEQDVIALRTARSELEGMPTNGAGKTVTAGQELDSRAKYELGGGQDHAQLSRPIAELP